MKRCPVSFAIAALLLAPAAQSWGIPTPVDVSTWSVVQYDHAGGQPDANWVLSAGNTVAQQVVNADASILLSDFDIAGTALDGSWRVDNDPSGDDDFMGFVFGYQDRGSFYLFDWKQSDQNASGYGFAEAGMSVKVVQTGGGDPTKAQLWQSADSAAVTILRHNTIPWADNTDYQFYLSFFPNTFLIEVTQGATQLESWTVPHSTYVDGKFGFYNYSQSHVRYAGFTQEDDPPDPSIPEPVTAVATLCALGAIGGYLRRRKTA